MFAKKKEEKKNWKHISNEIDFCSFCIKLHANCSMEFNSSAIYRIMVNLKFTENRMSKE